MSLSYRSSGRHQFPTVLLFPLVIALFSTFAVAQDDVTPKWDAFLGYQYLDPSITVAAPGSNPSNPTPFKLPAFSPGAGGALAYNVNDYLGFEIDAGGNWNKSGSDTTISIGPRLMLRNEGLNVFVHTLVGWNYLKVNSLDKSSGVGAILGGGIDLRLVRSLSWRIGEADYVWAHHNFADVVGTQSPDLRRPNMTGIRLRTGLVFNMGFPETTPPSASCSLQPSEVMVGEPITATATASNFHPKRVLTYSWSGNGGKVSGKDNTASIDTNGVAGGSYTVTARVTDPKAKKNGEASCSATYTVKEPPKNPPTMSCSATPTSVQIGATVNVSCTCTSPDNVPVTVSGWTSSGGTVSGSGGSATLNTTGAVAGPVTVNATCADSRGLSTSSSAQVTLENPPPVISPEVKQLEARLALHSIYFPTALPTAANPKGGLLASQQQTLTALASDFQKYLKAKPDAHLILEGHADPRGSVKYNQALSERRVERTKSFLVENGIPEGSIETKAFGDQHNLSAAEVKASIEQNPELTTEERQRIIRNMRTIILASNRRVDVTLSTTGQTSVRQYPFNAADSLTLIGGRQAAPKKVTKPMPKKGTKKK